MIDIFLKNFPKVTHEINKIQKMVSVEEHSYVSAENKILHPVRSMIPFYSFNKSVKKKMLGKFYEMIFFGLNYNAKRIKHFRKPWVLDLQKSHKVFVFENRNSIVKTKIFKRRVLFFSYERQKINELVNRLKSLRKQNSYSGHGLVNRDDKYKTKPGKIRQK